MLIKYNAQYDGEISELVKSYPMEWGESMWTVLALEQGVVVGIGSLSTNDFHLNREYLKVFVHPVKREIGIGREIFEALYAQSTHKKFQAAISSKDVKAISFVKCCGFKLARKCHTPQLKNDNPMIDTQYPTIQELSIARQNEVFALQFDNYCEFHHAINPLNEQISFHEWKEVVLDDLDLNQSYALLRDGEVEAYVLCYEGEEPGQIEIGYVGGREMASVSEYTIFYKQVADQLIKDFVVVEIEADDVDPYASALLNQYAYDRSDSFDTYIFG